MALRFYLGGSGRGKTTGMLGDIISQSMARPRDRFLVIVPEQFTIGTHRELVRLHPRKGIMNIDVLSFKRLAYRVFEELGINDARLLDDTGKTFILEKVALEEKKKLSYFGADIERPDNVASMKSVLSELMQYGISPDDLASSREGKGAAGEPEAEHEAKQLSRLDIKLGDIERIYRAFKDKLGESYMTAEEVPERLAAVAGQSGLIAGSVVAFDGFTGFTPVQMKLMRTILKAAKEVYVSVTIDAGANPYGKFRPTDLFALSRETIRDLRDMAGEEGITIEEPVRIDHVGRFDVSPSLSFLEQNLFRRKPHVYSGEEADIEIFEAANPLQEIEHAARTIKRLIRTEGKRYKDFAVISGDLESTGNYVREVFGRAGIPCFVDEKRSLLRNPFIEYLRAVMEVCSDGWSYKSMFRLLKCGMTDFPRDAQDHLENYVLAFGINGRKRWNEEWTRHYQGEADGEVPAINALRRDIANLINPLSEVMGRRMSTVREKTVALYEFMTRSHAAEKLKMMEGDFRESGRPDLEKEYSQVYAYVIDFLEKLVRVLGDEAISIKDYKALLEAGFSQAKVGIVPPGADQVFIGDMERSRLSDIKVLIFVQVNEGLIPKVQSYGDILTEADREQLAQRKIRLKPSSRQAIYIERFYLYLSMTKPQEKLILSYSVNNAKGEVIHPAYLIAQAMKLFPDLKKQHMSDDPRDFIEQPEDGLLAITEGLQRLGGSVNGIYGEEADPEHAKQEQEFMELFRWYLLHPDWRERSERLLEAAMKRKQPDQITRAAAKALYGSNLKNSASRLETFSGCEFSHFLKYGLRLKERAEFEFSSLDLGNIVHGALELFVKCLAEDDKLWRNLDDAEREQYAEACVDKITEQFENPVLYASARNSYQVNRIRRLMNTSVWALGEQLKRGDFEPLSVEENFRYQEELKSMNVQLPDGVSLTLVGKIDRIDTCEDKGNTYVEIIDYKTGNRDFDLTAVYHGLQLQLVVYLNAAVESLRIQGKQPVPAGIFYYEVKDPIKPEDGTGTKEGREKAILHELRKNGVVLKDDEVIRHFDRTLSPDNPDSDVIPVKLKKDGSCAATSKVLEPEAFEVLSRFVDRKIRRIGTDIMMGKADVNPYTLKSNSSCDYCKFRSVCRFDQKIPGYDFRNLANMKAEEVIQKMEDEVDELDS